MPPERAIKWIEANIVGGITIEQLRETRRQEMNIGDMMQNYTIATNLQCIIQMQIMCLFALSYLPGLDSLHVKECETCEADHAETSIKTFRILYALMFDHLFSYAILLFRNWEINKYGKLDIYGVMRAKRESNLAILEIFFKCFLFGYAANYIYVMEDDEF